MMSLERVLDKKWLRGKLLYLVEWAGYEEPSWEPVGALKEERVRGDD